MANHIGLDLGTFHTVASEVQFDGPTVTLYETVKSIALRGVLNSFGRQVVLDRNLRGEIVLAPKLRLQEAGEDGLFMRRVLKELAGQALMGRTPSATMAFSVPPGWSLEECQALVESVNLNGQDATFVHEPVALLIAAAFLAEHCEGHTSLASLLRCSANFLVCDWGAGTVDLAYVSTSWGEREGHTFLCKAERTLREYGGFDLARRIVDVACGGSAPEPRPESRKQLDFRLQVKWEEGQSAGGALVGQAAGASEERLNAEARELRAAFALRVVEALLELHPAADPRSGRSERPVVLLHGGPLESEELRQKVIAELIHRGVPESRIYLTGEAYCRELKPLSKQAGVTQAWRRDCLVSTGAAIFAARGKALPEYEYAVHLRDGSNRVCSTARLVRSGVLKGIVPVEVPHTGADYWVDVQQMRDGVATPVRQQQLGIHVRPGALVVYEISGAGVGFAKVEAYEATNTLTPERLPDARCASVMIPEKSTRFRISLERTA